MTESKGLSAERAGTAWKAADNRRPKKHIMEVRRVTIKLEDMSLIKGKINILSEPARSFDGLYDKHLNDQGTYFKRVSDIFTRGGNPFVVVFDVMSEGQTGGVLVINKKKILWVSPED
jgi:hypothetical protein